MRLFCAFVDLLDFDIIDGSTVVRLKKIKNFLPFFEFVSPNLREATSKDASETSAPELNVAVNWCSSEDVHVTHKNSAFVASRLPEIPFWLVGSAARVNLVSDAAVAAFHTPSSSSTPVLPRFYTTDYCVTYGFVCDRFRNLFGASFYSLPMRSFEFEWARSLFGGRCAISTKYVAVGSTLLMQMTQRLSRDVRIGIEAMYDAQKTMASGSVVAAAKIPRSNVVVGVGYNPLIGHADVMCGDGLFASKFSFNVYSFESKMAFGLKLPLERFGIANLEQGTLRLAIDSAGDMKLAVEDVAVFGRSASAAHFTLGLAWAFASKMPRFGVTLVV